MLRFEQRLQAFCPYGSEQYVSGLQALLDALCDLASAFEIVPPERATLPRQSAP
jgi:hypothetical protein